MDVQKREVKPVRSDSDVVQVRHTVRAIAAEMQFSLVDQTKLVTAASEIARNTLQYGGGGTAEIEVVVRDGKRGLRMAFEDRGPGIADVALALRDGFTSGSGLGLGLGGAKRLVNEFEIATRPGEGTRVTLVRWR
jgi:serine/threonine-protein kinase RsbT